MAEELLVQEMLFQIFLEQNNNIATASSASMLPIYCYGLSFDTSSDEDFFEIQTIAGVTYYVNLSFSHANGDIDMEWKIVLDFQLQDHTV